MDSVSFDQIDAALERLVKIPDSQLQDLTGKNLKAYERMNLAASTLYSTDHYTQILSRIQKYPRPEQIQPQTVGAFLFGSRKEVQMDIPEVCSLLDMGTLSRENTSMLEIPGVCQYQIFVFPPQGSGSQIHNPNSDQAYVYLSLNPEEKFEGLTEDQLTVLRKAGVTHAQVMGTANSTHHTIKPKTPLEQLKQTPRQSSGVTPAWALLAIGILVVILLVLLRK